MPDHDAIAIHWKPTPKQEQALVRREYEILYGGARGGGKTDAGQAWMTYDIWHARFAGLVIRRNADDLSDWVERASRMYAPTGVEKSGNPPIFRFPSGAYIKTGHLKDENAYEKYQGHEYQRILIEELTQIPSELSYLKLISSCRSTVDGLPAQVFATTNPGGPGHKWVKRRFVDPAWPGEPFSDPITGRGRIFIPALVDDNPYIMEKDPDYVRFLDGLPGDLREAWRSGSWDLVEVQGAYYGQLMRDALKERRICHVPYDKSALVHTAWDLGMDDSTSIIFWQAVGQEIRDIDYYECSGEGMAHYAKVLKDKGYNYGYHFGPHDLEVREFASGKTRREVARDLGIDFRVMPRVREKIDGIEMVRNILPFCFFDAEKCEYEITCLENFRKEFNEKTQAFSNKPIHDWASHGADAKQTQAQAIYQIKAAAKKPKRHSRPNQTMSGCGYGG